MFRKFMYGRYGNDQFNLFIIIISLVFWLLGVIFKGTAGLIFGLLQFIFLVWWALRAFSRSHYRRRQENAAFMRICTPVKNKLGAVPKFFKRVMDRKHKYFKCPLCKSRLRVPRGRGNITVTCPRCKHSFDEKS